MLVVIVMTGHICISVFIGIQAIYFIYINLRVKKFGVIVFELVNVPLFLESEVSLVLFLLILYNSLHVATSYMCLEAIKIPGLLNNMSQSIARSHS